MAYNHRKEEKKWLIWKEQEEKQLRELGVDENAIQRLYTHDWQQFKADRNFYEKQLDHGGTIEWMPQTDAKELKTAEDLLNSIENEELLAILEKVDKLTLEMLVMRTVGYSTEQICQKLNVSTGAYYNRIERIRKKLKIFFEND